MDPLHSIAVTLFLFVLTFFNPGGKSVYCGADHTEFRTKSGADLRLRRGAGQCDLLGAGIIRAGEGVGQPRTVAVN